MAGGDDLDYDDLYLMTLGYSPPAYIVLDIDMKKSNLKKKKDFDFEIDMLRILKIKSIN